jgi:transcriptional regulator of acetoin/glycerol metabolism
MLRITRKANGEVVFKVSGQLTAENVAEMETLIAAETKGRRRLGLKRTTLFYKMKRLGITPPADHWQD